jgi:hypothetical protein
MLRIGSVADPISGAAQIRRWRCGRIVMRGGRLVEIQHRLLAGSVSVAQVWWQSKYGRTDDHDCWLDYHQPLGMPGFLTLDYIRAGKRAGYKSFIGATHVLNEIARARDASAIVAHISNGNISDRFLHRIGWEEHLTNWNGRHWIRRFYNGYPESSLSRYVADLPALV